MLSLRGNLGFPGAMHSKSEHVLPSSHAAKGLSGSRDVIACKKMVEFVNPGFAPRFPISLTAFQTYVSLLPFGNPTLDTEDLHLDANGIHFHAALSRIARPRGLVILIHGYAGNVDVPCMRRSAKAILDAGFSVARLHLMDHGGTHSWNSRVFDASMADEHFAAVRQIARRMETIPIFVGGFSLGGNFALRMGYLNWRSKTKLRNLAGVFAISAPLNARNTARALDLHPLAAWLLREQWQRILKEKEQAHPGSVPFPDRGARKSISTVSRNLIRKAGFTTLGDFLNTFTIGNDLLKAIRVPAYLLAAADDPIIPVDDYRHLQPQPGLHVEITEKGGHAGFIKNLRLRCYYPERIVAFLEFCLRSGRHGRVLLRRKK